MRWAAVAAGRPGVAGRRADRGHHGGFLAKPLPLQQCLSRTMVYGNPRHTMTTHLTEELVHHDFADPPDGDDEDGSDVDPTD